MAPRENSRPLPSPLADARRLTPVPAAARPALDRIWIEAAAELGVPVARGGEAYVHWDGRCLHLADDPHLDADDTVAQLILHELCHALTQGEALRATPDWGLDNTSDDDAVAERACLRLQAHLLGGHGLRAFLYPTTVVQPFYLGLPLDALRSDHDPPSLPRARRAALAAARPPFARVLGGALAASADLLGLPRHRSGAVRAADPTLRCGDCDFRSVGGRCKKAGRPLPVSEDEPACVRFERLPDCRECAACCRSAYDVVLLTPRAPIARARPELVERVDGTLRLRRVDDHCAALAGEPGGPWQCLAYDQRPRTCRDFTPASRHCAQARARVGL